MNSDYFPTKSVQVNFSWTGPIFQDMASRPRVHLHFKTIEHFKNYYKRTKVSERTFSELIRSHRQRIRFDLDSKKDKYTTESWRIFISKICKMLSDKGEEIVLVYDMSDESKWSTHVHCKTLVTNCSCEAKKFFEYFIEGFDEADRLSFDASVYKKAQFIRVLGSCKSNRGERQKRFSGMWTGESFQKILFPFEDHLLVPYTELSKEEYCGSCNCEDRTETFQESQRETVLGFTPGIAFESKLNSLGYKLRNIKNGVILLDRIRPSYCKIHKRIHTSETAFIVNGKFYCRRPLD